MKENKFRAYDNVQRVFIYLVLEKNGRVKLFHNDAYYNSGHIGDWDQFTGLRDTSGAEIYEGDILGGTYEGCIIDFCDKCEAFQLSAYEHGCLACSGDVHWHEVVADKNITVIGNIRENLDLLM